MQHLNFNKKCKLLRNIGYKIFNVGNSFIIQEPTKNGSYVTILNTSIYDKFWISLCIGQIFTRYFMRVCRNKAL